MADSGKSRGDSSLAEITSAPLSPAAARALAAEALAKGQVLLALQPVMQARRPDRPAFHEALLRLRDRRGRIVPASHFIAAVEPTPLGRHLDRVALDLALTELAHDPGLRVSVNLSPLSLRDRPWQDTLARGLDADPTAGERLILEITERAVLDDPDALGAAMAALRPAGVCFALDDFGAGATALAQLRRHRFDILKIDGQFSRRIATDRDNQALVSAIAGLARHFEMLAVAEAVERPQDAAWLADAGIDALQGWHLGQPALIDRPTGFALLA
jgi:EAL domain-containing protein (putative c-di-GMP-specific phosphodiesterase class I)